MLYVPIIIIWQKNKWNDVVVCDDCIYERKFHKTINLIKKEDIMEIIAFEGLQGVSNNERIGKEPCRYMTMHSPLCFVLILSNDADEAKIISLSQSRDFNFNKFANEVGQLRGVILIDLRHYGKRRFFNISNRRELKTALTSGTYLKYPQLYKLEKHGYCISRSFQSYF